MRPLYLTSSGRGQNMIAVQIYMEDGRYLTDGKNEFVTFKSGATLPIMFIAFCADFERDNPTAADRFEVAALPVDLASVALNIRDYIHRYPDTDLTVPGQLAIWFARGHDAGEIRERFDFTPEDHRLALSLMRER